jgi:universal stress protein E
MRHIVVGVDLVDGSVGEGARLALEQARWIALDSGARVTVLHASHDDEHWDGDAQSFEKSADTSDPTQQGSLARVVEELAASGVSVELEVVEETPGLAIIRSVLRSGADLVIVGKRATSVHDQRKMGSVSLKLARKCPCVVSILKPGSRPRPACVVAATDRGPVGGRVVAEAAALASGAGGVLHVIHAIQVGIQTQMEGGDAIDAFIRSERDLASSEVALQLKSAGYEGEWEMHAGQTSPARAVLEAEQRLAPDVVVMGSISRAGIAGLLVGATAERMLGMLDCSLLIVKPDDFVCPVTLT